MRFMILVHGNLQFPFTYANIIPITAEKFASIRGDAIGRGSGVYRPQALHSSSQL